MKRTRYALYAGLAALSLTMAAPSFSADPSPNSLINAKSILTPNQAAAALVAGIIGEQVPSSVQLEVGKFFRDNAPSANNSSAPQNLALFSNGFARGLVGTALSGPRTPRYQTNAALPALPVDPANPPSLQTIFTLYGLAVTVAWMEAAYVAPDLAPWMSIHNTRSVGTYTKTRSSPGDAAVGTFFLSATCAARDPVTGKCTSVNLFSPTSNLAATKGVSVGTTWKSATTIVDIDILAGTALDANVLTDLLAFHLPISVGAGLVKTCTETFTFGTGLTVPSSFRGQTICVADNGLTGTLVTAPLDRVLATNAKYTFAYPLTAGEFPTRVTAMDILQVVYDALGSVWSQKPRVGIAGSPFSPYPALAPLLPYLPGTSLPELTTQAPPVNYFGLQVNPNSVVGTVGMTVINPLLAALKLGQIDIRVRSGVQTLDLAGYTGLPLPNPVLNWVNGPSVGYLAREVRSNKVDIMAVRWHNVGTTTVGQLVDNTLSGTGLLGSLANTIPSAKASIYYDVPKGQYSLTDTATTTPRLDTYDAVFIQDWNVAANAPPLVLPPTPPDLQGLIDSIQGVLDLVGGVAPVPAP
jgi:hypothetical protein